MKMICWCILIISFSAAAVNKTSAENCPTSAGVILINKNKTIPKEYLKDFNEIEKVLSDQAKSKDKNFILEEILPHNYVPKISSAENDFVNVLSEKLLSFSPPFDLSNIPGISNTCKLHSRHFVDSLKRFDFWAMKMHDATAKFSSGILRGNVNQFGDFDECLDVEADNSMFKGKYCLAYFQPAVDKSLKFINYLRRLAQSHEAFKSTFDDPGHRVPRFSTINFALCVPSTCSTNDIELGIKFYTEAYFNHTGVDFAMRVDEEMCQVKEEIRWENLEESTKKAIYCCGLLVLVLVLSTFYDYCSDDDDKSEWLRSFSLIKNSKSLFSTKLETGEIKTAHGIRFFNAIMLLISHKCMAIFFNPYVNRTSMTEILGKPFSVVARAASLYTDPFIMLSGMLIAYSFIGKLQKNGRINIIKEVAGRYFRIMPSLAFLIAFCTFILPLLGSGPQWNLVVSHHAGVCKQTWWRNLLFIHNWWGFSEMCLTHTHHVGIDTELFLTSPFLILMLWKWPKNGLKVIISLATLSTVIRYYVTYAYNLNNYVFFGTSIKQLFETADRMYIMPHHRFTVYAMGLLLGYILRMTKDHGLKLTSRQLTFGWYFSVGCLLAAFFGPAPMGDIDYKYNPTHAAYYAAFGPIAWCLFFAWIILLSHSGYSNKFIKMFEFRVFQFCTKISYSLYLVQFPIFFYNVGMLRAPLFFRLLPIFADIDEYAVVFLISILLTLCVEMPSNNLKMLILDGKKTLKPEMVNEPNMKKFN